MSGAFLRFEDSAISLDGISLMVNSASLSIAPSMQVERVYGDLNFAIAGAKTEFINFRADNHLKGKLELTFYISAETLGYNSIDRFFELAEVGSMDSMKTKIDESPINNNIVGRYAFDNMFLTSFSFDLKPFSLIQAKASYDIYGTIKKIPDRTQYYKRVDPDFAHSLKSFGDVMISGETTAEDFHVTSISYAINAERKTSNRIRGNEHSYIQSSTQGALPFRVSCEKIESSIDIEGNFIADSLNEYGDSQYINNNNIPNSQVDVFLYSLYGNKVSRFRCSGKIINQSYDISEGSHAVGKISIKEVVR